MPPELGFIHQLHDPLGQALSVAGLVEQRAHAVRDLLDDPARGRGDDWKSGSQRFQYNPREAFGPGGTDKYIGS